MGHCAAEYRVTGLPPYRGGRIPSQLKCEATPVYWCFCEVSINKYAHFYKYASFLVIIILEIRSNPHISNPHIKNFTVYIYMEQLIVKSPRNIFNICIDFIYRITYGAFVWYPSDSICPSLTVSHKYYYRQSYKRRKDYVIGVKLALILNTQLPNHTFTFIVFWNPRDPLIYEHLCCNFSRFKAILYSVFQIHRRKTQPNISAW